MTKQTPEGRVKFGYKDNDTHVDGITDVLERMKAANVEVWWTMPQGSLMARAGIPDYDVAINGIKVTVEAKAVGGKLSNFQKREHQRLCIAGVINIVVEGQGAIPQLDTLLWDIHKAAGEPTKLIGWKYHTIRLA